MRINLRRASDPVRICEEVRLTRRSVTAMLVASAGVLTHARAQVRINPNDVTRPPSSLGPRATDLIEARAGAAPTIYEVRRPDDFLVLNYSLQNLRVIGSAPSQQIARINAQDPGWIAVYHQPQSIAEQAYWGEPSIEKALAPGEAQARISGASRLVFQMPSEIAQADWGLDGLLDACRTWPMRLGDLAKPAPADLIRFIPSFRVLKISQKRLDDAAQVILASLPPDLRVEIGAIIPAAAQRIASRIESAAAKGQDFSDAEVDALVGAELRASLDQSQAARSFEHAFLSARALEAAAASRSLSVLTDVAAPILAQSSRPVAPRDLILRRDDAISAALNRPHPLDDDVTGIELPYRLVQSPLATAGWAHELAPVTRGGRTELWHTRLGARKAGGVADLAPEPLRALWSPDYGAPGECAPGPLHWALYGDERRDLVRLTAGFNEKMEQGSVFTPIPAIANKLILTALGGKLDLDGEWKKLPGTGDDKVDIEAWTHRAALGRDYFVRIVKAGRLFPFGHAASLVRITERVFEKHDKKGRVALLRQSAFILVRESVREYGGAKQQHDGRDFPFRSIEILTKVTPKLDPRHDAPPCDVVFQDKENIEPRKCDEQQEAADLGFVPTIGKADFQFRLVGVDGAGRRIPFWAALVFIADSKNGKSEWISEVIRFYADPPSCADAAKKERSTVKMGAVIQLAPQSSGGSLDGDTNIPTKSITFTAAPPVGVVAPGEPKYFPAVKESSIVLPAVKALLGSDKTPVVAFNGKYLDQGFGGTNAKGQIFLNVISDVGDKIGANPIVPSDKFGGMVALNLTPKALSRNFGVVTGDEFETKFGEGTFDPLDFFPDAKLFGVIDLKSVLRKITNITAGAAAGETPRFTTVELPDRIEAGYSIEQSDLNSIHSPHPLFEPMPGSRLKIDTKVVSWRKKDRPPEAQETRIDGAPETRIEGLVEHFQVNLYSCLILTFDKLSFVALPGKKPKVDVDLDPSHGVIFGGPLEFINALKDIIPSNGFADPAPIAVTPAGISAGYTLSLPAVQVGICSISNISIGASFNIPFTGEPLSARFNLAERHAPFNITVAMFGGGGFVALVVDTGGMREIEVQLEFAAKIEINLGVASGGVYIKGGFYFHLEEEGDFQKIRFEGFVELGGHLSVIGLITVSLVFHLALAYEKDRAAKTSRLFGQATLIVEVEILFFSTSVSVKVEKEFAGSKADPLFIDFIPTDAVWRRYCEAFAQEH